MFARLTVKRFLLMVMLVMTFVLPQARAEIITPAEFAVLMDYDSGKFLYEKNPDAAMKPASMAKMMTIYLTFERLKTGSLRMEDSLLVSEKAWRKRGSRTFLEPGSKVKIADLLRGVIVQSGNDAAIVLAEGLAGTEDAFAEEMTAKARELGMTNTVFGNSTGWPDEITTTTARDLAILAKAIIRDFPEYYPIFAEKAFAYNGINQNNRNPLIYSVKGADGLKTGHTEESGYGLTSSAWQNGQRMILVLNGLASSKSRRQESERLMELSFREYPVKVFFEKGAVLNEVPVWLGEADYVKITAGMTGKEVLPRTDHDKVEITLSHETPLPAPITAGDTIGEITVSYPGGMKTFPLLAGETVEKLPIYKQIGAFFKYIIFGATPMTTPAG